MLQVTLIQNLISKGFTRHTLSQAPVSIVRVVYFLFYDTDNGVWVSRFERVSLMEDTEDPEWIPYMGCPLVLSGFVYFLYPDV